MAYHFQSDVTAPRFLEELRRRFDFEATLDPKTALDTQAFPSSALPLVDALENASEEGDIIKVRKAFTNLREAVAATVNLRTGCALTKAIGRHHEEVVAYLLSEGVQVSHHEVKKATLLKNKAILQILFAEGWDIDRELGWSDPPALAYAVEDVELTTWFLAHGASPNAHCVLDMTPLSAAVQNAPFSVIEMLFDHGGSVAHGQLLHAAVWRRLDDRKAVVEYILSKGAPVNAVMYHDMPELYSMRQPFGLGTPLHDAAAVGDEELAELLVSRGARLDARDSLGSLPFERAEGNGHIATAKVLRAGYDTYSA